MHVMEVRRDARYAYQSSRESVRLLECYCPLIGSIGCHCVRLSLEIFGSGSRRIIVRASDGRC